MRSFRYRLLLVLAAATLFAAGAHAQRTSVSCYLAGEKQDIPLSDARVVLAFDEGTPFTRMAEITGTEPMLKPLEAAMLLPAPKVVLCNVIDGSASVEIDAMLARLMTFPEVRFANRMLQTADGTLQGILDRFVVKLRSEGDLLYLQDLAQRTGTRVTEKYTYEPNVYFLATDETSQGNALEMATLFTESGHFVYAEPDFLRLMKRLSVTNDPFGPIQWAHNNTGSNYPVALTGVAGADMKVQNAWNTTTGSSSIRIAIIDEGTDLSHPDLVANLLGGFDATGLGSNGGPSANDAHGTGCAGIAAAVGNNNLGVVGVAYTSKIVPVRIAYSDPVTGDWVTTDAVIANGMNWAWQSGLADVLSNSWGGGGQSSLIDGAITNAITFGRGGKGALVLFAAGNSNNALIYPAWNPNTIAVAATSMCDTRKSPTSCDGENWWGSCYGTGLDISAPGVKIVTTDITGAAGYTPTDYITYFNGTSSATPNAAGVAALILSVNPKLTYAQARMLLETTCDKVGGYTYNSGVSGQPNGTWSTDLGYGRVNAQSAVTVAVASIETITTGNPTSSCLNPGGPITVPYVASGLYTTGNTFTLQLSDATGSFASPVTLGSVVSTSSGSITGTIPAGTTAGALYRVRVVADMPSTTGSDNGSNLLIKAAPTAYTMTGGGTYCTGGTGVPVGLSNSQTGVIYRLKLGSFLTGTTAPGTGGAISFGNQTVVGTYTADGVDGVNSCTADMTGSVAVAVNPVPTVDAVANQTVCNGSPASAITFTGAVGGTVFNWTNNTPGIGLAASGSGNIPAFTAVNTGTAPVIATITVTPSYTSGGTTCTGTPITFTITVNPIPTVTAVTNQVLCATGASTAVTFSGSVAGTVYNWTNNNSSIGLASSGTNSLPVFTAVNAGTTPVIATITVTPTYTNAGTTCSGTPISFTITVNPKPTVNTVTSQTVCAGGATAAITFSGSVAGTVYNWTNNTTSIGLAASGSGNIAAFTAINSGTTPVTATITVTPTYTNAGVTCTGTLTTFTITVNPTPTVNTVSNQVVCNSGATAAITFSGAVAGTVYNWTNTTPSIGLAASGSGNIAAFTAVNTSTVPVVATITVTPVFTSGASCTGTPKTFTITVNPTPNVSAITSQTLCATFATSAVTPTGTIPGTVFNWTNNNTTIGLAASGSGTIPAFTAVNTSQTPVIATITVTPTYTNAGLTCTGAPVTYTYTVNPLPLKTVTASGPLSFCDGLSVTLTGPAGPSGYLWSKDGNPIAGATGISYIATTSGTYRLITSNTYGCKDSSTAIVVTVYPLPPAVVIPRTPLTVCQDDNVILDANTGTGFTYLWYVDGRPMTTETKSTLVTTRAGVYFVDVTNSFGCVTRSASFTVVVKPRPDAVITVIGSRTPCAGDAVTLQASAGAGYTYQWLLNSVAIPGATQQLITVTKGGDYQVTVSGPNGCSRTSIVTSIVPLELPIAYIPNDIKVNLCTGETTTLTAHEGASNTYAWYFNGTLIAGATLSSYTTGNAGDYYVVVTGPNGCKATSNTMTVTVNPIPTAVITPGPTVLICDGDTQLLTVPAVKNGSYAWTRDGISLPERSNTLAVSAPGTYVVMVQTSTPCTAFSAPVTVSTVPRPVADVTPVGDVPICAGNTVTLSVAPVANALYQWDLDGVAIPGATALTYTAALPGSYRVHVILATCSAVSAETKVRIVALPDASITAQGPTKVCDGLKVPLSASSQPGCSYQWMLNGTDISGATSNTYDAGASGAYSVRVTTTEGCTSVSLSAVSVTILPAPVATVTPAGPIDICNGTVITLEAARGTNYVYQWMKGGTAIAGATGRTYNATDDGSYTVLVTAPGGCTATSPAVSITMRPSPDATISASGPTTFCEKSDVTLSVPYNATNTYQWLKNGVAIPNAIGSSYHAILDGSYACDVTSSNGCTLRSAAEVVTVLPIPSRSVTVQGSQLFCSGGSATLVAASGTGYTYQWMKDGSPMSGATNSQLTVTQSGTYRVNISTSTLCASTSDPVVITVIPKVNVGPVNGPSTSNPGAISHHSIANPVPGASYSWRVSGGIIRSGQTSPAIDVEWTSAGNQSISVTAVLDCSDTTTVSIFIDGTVAVENAGSPGAFTLYPNPSEGDATLGIPARARGRELTITIYSVIGEKMSEQRVPSGSAVYRISTGTLAAGTYRVMVRSGADVLLEHMLVRK